MIPPMNYALIQALIDEKDPIVGKISMTIECSQSSEENVMEPKWQSISIYQISKFKDSIIFYIPNSDKNELLAHIRMIPKTNRRYYVSDLNSRGADFGMQELGQRLFQTAIESMYNNGFEVLTLVTDNGSACFYFEKFNMRFIPNPDSELPQEKTEIEELNRLTESVLTSTKKGSIPDTTFADFQSMHIPFENGQLMEGLKERLFSTPVLNHNVPKTIKMIMFNAIKNSVIPQNAQDTRGKISRIIWGYV
jgi:hypothetical protein